MPNCSVMKEVVRLHIDGGGRRETETGVGWKKREMVVSLPFGRQGNLRC